MMHLLMGSSIACGRALVPQPALYSTAATALQPLLSGSPPSSLPPALSLSFPLVLRLSVSVRCVCSSIVVCLFFLVVALFGLYV